MKDIALPNMSAAVVAAFKSHICSVCGLCSQPNPSFCLFLYQNNHERFFDLVRYFRFEEFQLTFIKFFGLVCCSEDVCPAKMAGCEKFSTAIECYKAFILQNRVKLTSDTEDHYWDIYGMTKLVTISEAYRLPKNMKKRGPKKLRKKVNKALKIGRKSVDWVSSGPHVSPYTGKSKGRGTKYRKKEVSTIMICNSDPEWEEQIKSYLET